MPAMKKALVVYRSQTGTTRRYAASIGAHLQSLGVEPVVASTDEFRPQMLDGVDGVLLGCWTHGLMIAFQHPDERWVEFARRLPALGERKVGLFTTYLVATGSMFWSMKRRLAGKAAGIAVRLKARGDRLTDANRRELERFVAG